MNRIIKKQALPLATSLFALPALRRLPAILEMTGAALQSKRGGGYSAVWQEIEGALNFLRTPNPIIFDVGANVGNWSTSIVKSLPGIRKLIMFEPQPSCWPFLEKICEERIILEKIALGNISGTLDFWTNTNSEISSFHEKAGGGPNSHRIQVQCISIDDYIAQHKITAIDYMKIDVEGHELAVIKGALESIKKKIIRTFSFEFGPADVASRTFFNDFWENLTDLNLSLYRIGHDGFAIRIAHYSYDLEYFGGVANYIASYDEPKKAR